MPSKTIWKFSIHDVKVDIQMPKGAEILHLSKQGRAVCFWAKVDPSAPIETRAFEVFATGEDLPNDREIEYVGTVYNDPWVWHVFERF